MMKNTRKPSLSKSFSLKYDLDSLLADSSSDEKWMKDKKLKVQEVKFGSESKRKMFSAKMSNGNLESKKIIDGEGSGRFSSSRSGSNEKARKANDILAKVTRKISRIYAAKIGALLARQKEELDDFKKSFVVGLENEVEEWKKYIAFVKNQEEKLQKILVKLRNNLNSSEMQSQKLQIIKKKHEAFMQKYEVMTKMHWSEMLSMKNEIMKEISEKNIFGITMTNEKFNPFQI